jgi:hypothetical protein
MSEQNNELIREAFLKLASTVAPDATILGEIESVDEAEGTCVVVDDDVTYNDVRLHSVLNGEESISIIPEEGSYVIAARIEGGEDWYVLNCSKIAKWRCKSGDVVQEITSNGFTFSKGSDNMIDAILKFIDAFNVMVIAQGTMPDPVKISEAKLALNNLKG